ncbi:MAG: ABC transporter permease [Candidatus Lokiarchaeota archaeon]|nr:ABC transporter permease [Candidatus Lokiarchaeota archaeon]
MSFFLLYFDELKGYYKSKVMIILWIGLPILVLLFRLLLFIAPEALSMPSEISIPISSLVGFIVSSIGGALSAVMLSTSITSEKNKHVYDLFLIRPVKRYNLILSKYFAVFSCLIIATFIAYTIGILFDLFTITDLSASNLLDTLKSIGSTLSIMSTSCSIGIIFGISLSSVAASAILSMYVGNQLLSVFLVGAFFLQGQLDILIFNLLMGSMLTAIFLTLAVIIFNKKQL